MPMRRKPASKSGKARGGSHIYLLDPAPHTQPSLLDPQPAPDAIPGRRVPSPSLATSLRRRPGPLSYLRPVYPRFPAPAPAPAQDRPPSSNTRRGEKGAAAQEPWRRGGLALRRTLASMRAAPSNEPAGIAHGRRFSSAVSTPVRWRRRPLLEPRTAVVLQALHGATPLLAEVERRCSVGHRPGRLFRPALLTGFLLESWPLRRRQWWLWI
jgi:hypothetical protein